MGDKRKRINLNDMGAVRREMARNYREAVADGATPLERDRMLRTIQRAIFDSEFEARLRALEDGYRR